jgi:hypothetical protein
MTTKEVALTICEKIQNEYPKRPIWQTMLEIEDLIDTHVEKQLSIHNVSQQRELLEWLSSEDYFNIPKDEISEILEDWKTYNSNCG